MHQWENQFFNYISDLESADAAHDIAHVQRVVVNAKKIADQENADQEVVIPAAWLHDCVSVSKSSPLRAKASTLSAEKAKELLMHWNYPEEKIKNIQHAIQAHSYSANIAPTTLEAKIVQDADRLDSIGAIGVARMMMVGGKLDRNIYSPDDPFCKTRTADDGKWTVDHFYTKLLKLNQGFHTISAQKEAQKRHDYMLGFLKQLETEILI